MTGTLLTKIDKIKGPKNGQIKKWTPLLLSQFFITRNFVAWLKKIPSL